MRQINLKSDAVEAGKTRAVSLSLILGLTLLIVSGVIAGGLFLYEAQLQKNTKMLEEQDAKLIQGVNAQKFQELYDLQGRILDVKEYSSATNNQVEVLNVISEKTFDNTLYESLSIKQTSSSSSSVDAVIVVDNSDQLASQLNAYKQSSQIEDIKLESSILEERGTVASLSFSVKAKNNNNDELVE